MSSVKPIVLALVICDQAIREAGSNKYSLIGTFNSIMSEKYPCQHPQITIYLAITEGRGKMDCKLRLINVTTQKKLFELPGQIDFSNPTAVGELAFQLNNFPFESPGVYQVEFAVGDSVIATRKIVAAKAEPKKEEAQG